MLDKYSIYGSLLMVLTCQSCGLRNWKKGLLLGVDVGITGVSLRDCATAASGVQSRVGDVDDL